MSEINERIARFPPMETNDHPIRVTFVQPALAKYRIPVFQELARRPGIDLQVVYGAVPGLPNVEAEGFRAVAAPLHEFRIAGRMVSFHPAEWSWSSRQRTDVIVLRWSPRSMTLPPALIRARLCGLPTVLWGHGYSKSENGPRRGSRKWTGRKASAIVFYEPRTREAYIKEGWNPDRLFVALNSLDNTEIEAARDFWLSDPQRLAEFQRENHLDSRPVVLFVSRLHPANRLDLLLQATAQLVRASPGLKAVIIGNGSKEKERLRRLVDVEGIADNVVFHDAIYDEHEIAPWFLSATAFCYPANIGLSLIHAMWYGLPVVTSNNFGIQNPEIVGLENGVNGLTFNHGDSASLADTLRQIIDHPSRRNAMSQSARATMSRRFTIPRMVNGLESAIRFVSRSIKKSA